MLLSEDQRLYVVELRYSRKSVTNSAHLYHQTNDKSNVGETEMTTIKHSYIGCDSECDSYVGDFFSV